MCLSEGVNEKLCTFSFSVLVTDCSHLPTPPRCPLLLLFLFLLLSTSSRAIWDKESVITRPVDSAALRFEPLLSHADGLIKHVNWIYQTRFYNYRACKCNVMSDVFISLSAKLFEKCNYTTSTQHTHCLNLDKDKPNDLCKTIKPSRYLFRDSSCLFLYYLSSFDNVIWIVSVFFTLGFLLWVLSVV